MFASNSAGTKTWTVSYLPFGGVHASTGTPINLRFPGQWFQLEAGLNQNWMRDYDPTTGRYLQVDPLGLVDGSSVYGYAGQSPLRWSDPRGENLSLALAQIDGAFDEVYTSDLRSALLAGYSSENIENTLLAKPKNETFCVADVVNICTWTGAIGTIQPSPGYFPRTVCTYVCRGGKELNITRLGLFSGCAGLIRDPR